MGVFTAECKKSHSAEEATGTLLLSPGGGGRARRQLSVGVRSRNGGNTAVMLVGSLGALEGFTFDPAQGALVDCCCEVH